MGAGARSSSKPPGSRHKRRGNPGRVPHRHDPVALLRPGPCAPVRHLDLDRGGGPRRRGRGRVARSPGGNADRRRRKLASNWGPSAPPAPALSGWRSTRSRSCSKYGATARASCRCRADGTRSPGPSPFARNGSVDGAVVAAAAIRGVRQGTGRDSPGLDSDEAGFVGGFEGLLFGLAAVRGGHAARRSRLGRHRHQGRDGGGGPPGGPDLCDGAVAGRRAPSAETAAADALTGYGRDPSRAGVSLADRVLRTVPAHHHLGLVPRAVVGSAACRSRRNWGRGPVRNSELVDPVSDRPAGSGDVHLIRRSERGSVLALVPAASLC